MKRLNILIAILSIGILSVYLPSTNATLTTNTEWMQEENTKNNNKVEKMTNLPQETTENTTTENTIEEETNQNSSTETIEETFDSNFGKNETPSIELETPKTANNSIQKEETIEKTTEANESTNEEPEKTEITNDNLEEKTERNNTITPIAPTIPKPATRAIQIVDKSSGNYCAQAIEYFYEDNEYKYYFNCIKSNNIYVIINKEEYKLTDALNNGIVTMKELNDAGYNFNKIAKNNKIM